MRRKIVWAVAACVSALTAPVYAQDPAAGTTAFGMLNLSYSAREIAMAGASIGMPMGIDGYHGNPAALGYSNKMQAAAGYRSWVEDVWGGFVSFGLPVRESGFWAISLVNLSEGDVDEVMNENGIPVETGRTFGANGFSGSLTWARSIFKGLAAGVSIKGMYHTIGTKGESYSADGFALDCGVQYRILKDRFVAGVVLRNLGFVNSTYSTDIENVDLPLAFGLGVSYNPRHIQFLRVALDIEDRRGASVDIQPGLEIDILRDLLMIRAGYAFSGAELEELFANMRGESQPDYVKENWTTFTVGLGLATDVRGAQVRADAAVEFNKVGSPTVAITLAGGF